MNIHVIGDSHGGVFRHLDAIETFRCLNNTTVSSEIINSNLGKIFFTWIGAITAFRVGRDQLSVLDVTDPKYHIRAGDCVIYTFGEIDCRNNIGKHVNENNYKINIENVVNGYIETLKINHQKRSLRLTSVYNVIPPARQSEILRTHPGESYPSTGTDKERAEYTHYFNQCLKEKCIEEGFYFFDIYDTISDDNGMLNTEMASHDALHVCEDSDIVRNVLNKKIDELKNFAEEKPMPLLTINRLNSIVEKFENSIPDADEYTTFIETGTYLGETVREICPYFKNYHTIELSEYHYNNLNLQSPTLFRYLGDSSIKLPEILKKLKDDEKCVFWLDGHWSGGNTARGDKDCPLLEEIESINKLYKANNALILIDDFRLFGTNITEDWSDITSEKVLNSLTNFNIEHFVYTDVLCILISRK
tara:strand:- start:47 stop:1300 length:1254 start_codon:yes stop_codon:yes gene_type:complete